MSFSINLAGHSSGPHNAEVIKVFENAVRGLRAIPGNTVTGSGYSSDGAGSITLDANAVKDPADSEPEG